MSDILDQNQIRKVLEEGYTKDFKNESVFRSMIVNKLIEALGWDIYEDVDHEAEIKIGTTKVRVDYIVESDSFSKFAIEVKSPSHDILSAFDYHQQLFSYLRVSDDLDFGLLYNGKSMVLIRVDSVKAVPIWKPGDGIDKVLLFSKGVYPNGLDDLFNKDSELETLSKYVLGQRAGILSGIVKQISDETGLSEAYVKENLEIQLLLKDFSNNNTKSLNQDASARSKESSKTRPAKVLTLRIDGESLKANDAKDILIQTTEWIIKKKKFAATDMRVPSGKKRYIVNNKPVHKSGLPFVDAVRLTNGAYLECNNAHSVHEKYARKLLELFGFNKNILEVEWEL